MSIQGIMSRHARNMLKLTSNYINEMRNPIDAANARGTLDIYILNTRPCLDDKTADELEEFDAVCLHRLYQCFGDNRV